MVRLGPKAGLAFALTLLAAGCAEQRFPFGVQTDTQSPTVSIVVPASDTINVQNGFTFTVDATDNLGLKTITVTLTAGLSPHDTTFTTAVTSVGWGVTVPQAESATLGGPVLITATAVDGNNNATTDTVTVYAVNPKALIVTLVRPTAGAVTAPGKQLPIEVKASQVDGLLFVGWRTIPGTAAVTATDTLRSPSLPDTLVIQDTLTVPATTTAGTFSVVGFAMDASNRVVSTAPVVVTVQLVVTDTTGPIVTFSVAERVELRDSITVRARDPSGISLIGWVAYDTAGTQVGGGTTALSGSLTDVIQRYDLNLNFGALPLPQLAIIKAFATDAAGNTDSARVDTLTVGSAVRADSITVVNGITKPFPSGGRIADAIYNPNRNEVYLTNLGRDQLEVFRIADTSFGTPGVLARGSQPWGIALWPHDTTTGANGDTVVVANSGGTNLSIVNVAASPPREVRRQPLPAYGVQTVKTVQNTGGGVDLQITEYHFDDRPQYVGTVCRGGNCTSGGGGDVVAVYSTTPTVGQSLPFPRRASVRWEKLTGTVAATGCLTVPESHFFWEQAGRKPGAADTLAVVVRRCGTSVSLLHPLVGIIVSVDELGFLDTTFVRNSGNFARAFIGEGGSGTPTLSYARALTFDVNVGVTTDTTLCCDLLGNPYTVPVNRDRGASPALDVRNFITNTSARVKSIATNFNGVTNMIRADSVYVIDANLRLQGLLPIGGANPGMDLNFNHNFDAKIETSPTGLSPNERIVFVASEDPVVDVFDTYFYGKITSIPIRDPIIGPLRVAKLPTGEQLLVGVTARGVVTVRLPAVTNPFQAARR